MARSRVVVEVQGLSTLLAQLKALPPEIVSKNGGLIRRALFAGANIVKKEVQSNAPVSQGKPTSGRLRRNVILIRTKNPNKWGASEEYLVTVRRGPRSRRASAARNRSLARRGLSRKEDPRDAFYARFLEMGTKHIEARAFIGQSFENRKKDALDKIIKSLRQNIKRTVRKLGGT